MYTIEYLPVAKDDLLEIVEYIGKELKNPEAVYELMDELTDVSERLESFPYEYQVYTPLKTLKQEYRRAPIKNYVMFYWVDEVQKKVTITRVLYSRRKYVNLLV